MSECAHNSLLLDVSEYGLRSGFKRVNDAQRAAAFPSKGRDALSDATIYPAPLVLPDDALIDPGENEPQSYDEYVELDERNEATPVRNTIYLVAPPKTNKSASFIQEWTKPSKAMTSEQQIVSSVEMHKQLRDYLAAFYHGMPVKLYDGKMSFVRHGNNKSKTPAAIDVAFGDGLLLEVRTRACPDKIFARQLNLNDLIDVLVNVLPDDAFAITMLVDHDVWEDDEDDFTCGRAYGASRVALVSSARYNPALDAHTGLDLQHAWPASHCQHHVDRLIADYESAYGPPAKKRGKSVKQTKPKIASTNVLQQAVDKYRTTLSKVATKDSSVLSQRWLSRLCRTVSHELGHCIGIDHCCYYACLMQSTSGLVEDSRQPMYLCPVDEAKLALTTGSTAAQLDEAMLRLLRQAPWTMDPTFAAFETWLRLKCSK